MTFTTTNPAKPTIVKDPDAILDYSWDFSNVIDDGDSIATVEFIVDDPESGLVVVNQTLQGNVGVAWLSGGVPGQTWGVTCRYHTASTPARVDDRTLYFSIKDR